MLMPRRSNFHVLCVAPVRESNVHALFCVEHVWSVKECPPGDEMGRLRERLTYIPDGAHGLYSKVRVYELGRRRFMRDKSVTKLR